MQEEQRGGVGRRSRKERIRKKGEQEQQEEERGGAEGSFHPFQITKIMILINLRFYPKWYQMKISLRYESKAGQISFQ